MPLRNKYHNDQANGLFHLYIPVVSEQESDKWNRKYSTIFFNLGKDEMGSVKDFDTDCVPGIERQK